MSEHDQPNRSPVGESASAAPDRLLTVPEIAARLGVTPQWVYRHSTRLGAYRLGKYVRFSWGEVLLALKTFRLAAEPNDRDEAQN